eukprot:SM000023S07618  [mRNA]  locus=s23:538465:542620:+ [translate_table: standard]
MPTVASFTSQLPGVRGDESAGRASGRFSWGFSSSTFPCSSSDRTSDSRAALQQSNAGTAASRPWSAASIAAAGGPHLARLLDRVGARGELPRQPRERLQRRQRRQLRGDNRKADRRATPSCKAPARAALVSRLLAEVLRSRRELSFTPEALHLSARLLEINPEVYTAWNYRKLALLHRLDAIEKAEEASESDGETGGGASGRDGSIAEAVRGELILVEKALAKNHKSYGAWHHRKWVLSRYPASLDHEYGLLGKLLAADSRNFNGWIYRRCNWKDHITCDLIYFSSFMEGIEMRRAASGLLRCAQPCDSFLADKAGRGPSHELQYTTEKINENFSNYSAWHYRSDLLTRIHAVDPQGERGGGRGPAGRIGHTVLEEEFELVKQAFYTEPDDQSGWMYHTWLLEQMLRAAGIAEGGGGALMRPGAMLRLPDSVHVVAALGRSLAVTGLDQGSGPRGGQAPAVAREVEVDEEERSWALQVLEGQIAMCRELLDLEGGSSRLAHDWDSPQAVCSYRKHCCELAEQGVCTDVKRQLKSRGQGLRLGSQAQSIDLLTAALHTHSMQELVRAADA